MTCKLKIFLVLSLLLLPVLTFAAEPNLNDPYSPYNYGPGSYNYEQPGPGSEQRQQQEQTGTIQWLIEQFLGIMGSLIPVIIGLALLAFLWGLFGYLKASGDDTALAKARGTMIYGVIILFVMVSIWGLVRVLQRTTGLENSEVMSVPKLAQ